MLRNPDIAPNATINHWIMSILMFQFTIVHVPTTLHGPDGLSHRNQQPNDDPIDPTDGNFNEWVDNMYGFMHFINPTTPTAKRVLTFIMGTRANPEPQNTETHESDSESEPDDDLEEEENEQVKDVPCNTVTRHNTAIYLITYANIPRKTRAILDDDRLDLVRKFLRDLVPPPFEERQLKRFIRYCLEFFLDGM
jgi:hypothetical protein